MRWKFYLDTERVRTHPCLAFPVCCVNVQEIIAEDLALVMTLMKHALHLGTAEILTDDFIVYLERHKNMTLVDTNALH